MNCAMGGLATRFKGSRVASARIIHVGWDKLAQMIGGPSQAAQRARSGLRRTTFILASEGPPPLQLPGPALPQDEQSRPGTRVTVALLLPVLGQVRLCLAQDFDDCLAVGIIQLAEFSRCVFSRQNLPQPAVDVIARQFGK